MIVYLDTSAVVPVLIDEPSTAVCRRIWGDADRLVTSRLTYVEVAAALAMAERQARISRREREEAWSNFTEIWPDVDVVDVTSELVAVAADFTVTSALRGYDAVHCASAVEVSDTELVAASGDAHLLAAWREVGIAVLATNDVR